MCTNILFPNGQTNSRNIIVIVIVVVIVIIIHPSSSSSSSIIIMDSAFRHSGEVEPSGTAQVFRVRLWVTSSTGIDPSCAGVQSDFAL